MVDLDNFVDVSQCDSSTSSKLLEELESGFGRFFEEDMEYSYSITPKKTFCKSETSTTQETGSLHKLPIRAESISFPFSEKNLKQLKKSKKRAENFTQEDLDFWKQTNNSPR